MNLIIVESPTKARTIKKILGKDYRVESSFGHIRDLPKSKLGIDIENGFEPEYSIPSKSRETIANLSNLAKKSKLVILASDGDREGEAIAWHLSQALNLNKSNSQRIVFNEITKNAILNALENPREIDQDLVDAQQARRILDRLVGFKLSPFLWEKVVFGLSAGRVQSVATRLIVEREREIKDFKIEKYWSLGVKLEANNKKPEFLASLNKINNKKFDEFAIGEKAIKEIDKKIKKSNFKVVKIEAKEISKNPPAPFTTSSLQQTANRFFGFSAKQTMTLAQKLYEQGYISYMRTDSTNLSSQFTGAAKKYLEKTLGREYALKSARIYKTKKKDAQEAHEAIRPSSIELRADALSAKLDNSAKKLYELIWQRSLASQMPAAKLSSTTILLEADDAKDKYLFRSSGQALIFDAYLRIYPEKISEQSLPDLKEGEELKLLESIIGEHSTKPPARYSDAGLVKILERHGIGRPSTYVPTINTIITRNYVFRDEAKRLAPNETAFIVNDLLVNHFPEIVDYNFTAGLEDKLDLIAQGEKKWQPVISEFYEKFSKNLEEKQIQLKKSDIIPEEKTEEICEKCSAPMVKKIGRFGKFLACSNYPECKNTKNLSSNGELDDKKEDPKLKELQKEHKDKKCPKCSAELIIRSGRNGYFLACSAYPKCKHTQSLDEDMKDLVDCPKCKTGKIVKKFSRRGPFYACNAYPDCKNAYSKKPTGDKCSICKSLLVEDKSGKISCSNKECETSK